MAVLTPKNEVEEMSGYPCTRIKELELIKELFDVEDVEKVSPGTREVGRQGSSFAAGNQNNTEGVD